MTHDPYHNPIPPPQDPTTDATDAAADTGAAPADELRFDRAESATPTSPAAVAGFQPAPSGVATACAVCRRPIADYYFEAGGKVLCPNCQQMIAASLTGGSGFVRFFKATVFGVGAAVVGAAVWWAVGHFFHVSSGLIAILIGFMVGGAVRAGAERRGGAGYQILALVIAYLAVGAGIIAADLTSPESKAGQESPVVVVVISVLGVFVGPILAAVSSPVVGIIIAFALWEAWKINKHRPVVFNGPYRVAPPGGVQPMDAQAYAGAPAPPYPYAYPAPGAPAYAPPAGPAYAPPPAPPQAAPGAWPPPPGGA